MVLAPGRNPDSRPARYAGELRIRQSAPELINPKLLTAVGLGLIASLLVFGMHAMTDVHHVTSLPPHSTPIPGGGLGIPASHPTPMPLGPFHGLIPR